MIKINQIARTPAKMSSHFFLNPSSSVSEGMHFCSSPHARLDGEVSHLPAGVIPVFHRGRVNRSEASRLTGQAAFGLFPADASPPSGISPARFDFNHGNHGPVTLKDHSVHPFREPGILLVQGFLFLPGELPGMGERHVADT